MTTTGEKPVWLKGDFRLAYLKPCKTCGREVSTSARRCPHCGQENPTTPDFKDMSTGEKAVTAGAYGITSIIMIVIGIIVFIIILMFC
ncbi:MAG: hypothetical protein ACC609_11560 [Methanobacterium formicicum]